MQPSPLPRCHHLRRANPPPPCCLSSSPPQCYPHHPADALPLQPLCHHCRHTAVATTPPPRRRRRCCRAAATTAFVLSSASLLPPLRYRAATAGCCHCAISVAAAALPATATQLPRFPPPLRCRHRPRAVAELPPPPPLCCHHRCVSAAAALPPPPPPLPLSQLTCFCCHLAATIAAAPPLLLPCCHCHRRFAVISTALPLLLCCHCRHRRRRCLCFCRFCRFRLLRRQAHLRPFLFC